MLKDNKLKTFREKKGYSQEQMAMKMGLSNKRGNPARDIISKFENGTTESWDIKNCMKYANFTEISLDDIARTLYPEDPYCKNITKENEESIEEQKDESFKDKEYELPEPSYENIFVTGKKESGKTWSHVIPETISSMNKGFNVFLTLDSSDKNAEIIIRKTAKETGHDVHIVSYPFTDINFLSLLNEPEAINDFSESISGLYISEEISKGKFCKEILRNVLNNTLWKTHPNRMYPEPYNFETIYSYLKTHGPDDYYDLFFMERIINDIENKTENQIKMLRSEISRAHYEICECLEEFVRSEKKDAYNIKNFIRNKHILIFLLNPAVKSTIPSLTLEQYVRIANNRMENKKTFKTIYDTGYKIILDDIQNMYCFNSTDKLIKWAELNKEHIHFLCVSRDDYDYLYKEVINSFDKLINV